MLVFVYEGGGVDGLVGVDVGDFLCEVVWIGGVGVVVL